MERFQSSVQRIMEFMTASPLTEPDSAQLSRGSTTIFLFHTFRPHPKTPRDRDIVEQVEGGGSVNKLSSLAG